MEKKLGKRKHRAAHCSWPGSERGGWAGEPLFVVSGYICRQHTRCPLSTPLPSLSFLLILRPGAWIGLGVPSVGSPPLKAPPRIKIISFHKNFYITVISRKFSTKLHWRIFEIQTFLSWNDHEFLHHIGGGDPCQMAQCVEARHASRPSLVRSPPWS